jgi:aspartate ammonia-lyase
MAGCAMSCRRERDLRGTRDIPADVYLGIHTLRAVEDFPDSLHHLRQICSIIARQWVSGITLNSARLAEMVRHNIDIVTALSPYIGYERSFAVAREAHDTGRGVCDRVLEKGWLTREELDRVLSPEALTHTRTSRFRRDPRDWTAVAHPAAGPATLGLSPGRTVKSDRRCEGRTHGRPPQSPFPIRSHPCACPV